jgi:3-oxoisoapionate kinase
MSRLITFYGDDFTGSTDVMEALSTHGIKTILFTRLPTPEEFAPYTDYDAVGVAGTSRSQTPEWMDNNLPEIFEWLNTLQASFIHYKVCSTFDSSPRVGSIGRAIEIGVRIFNQSVTPLIVGAPQLKRYTFAGHLFAGYQGETWRIDRHPVMSCHPVTPMHESDLRLHLAHQTAMPVQVIDVHDAVTQLQAGQHLLLEKPKFIVGSSGVEYALVQTLPSRTTTFAPVPPVEQMLVVSGSVSPTTERQIRHALAHGFSPVELDPQTLDIEAALTTASAVLHNGGSPLIYTALGPASDRHLTGDRSAIGQALGRIAQHCILNHRLARIVVAGGDTSSHALAELDILTLETRYPLTATPGSPLCIAKTPQGHTIEIALKGGQVGSDDYFLVLRDGLM